MKMEDVWLLVITRGRKEKRREAEGTIEKYWEGEKSETREEIKKY